MIAQKRINFHINLDVNMSFSKTHEMSVLIFAELTICFYLSNIYDSIFIVTAYRSIISL